MVPAHFVSLDDFHAHKLWSNEVLPTFYHKLRQLVKQAMLEASEDTSKHLILYQFMSMLSANISKHLRTTGEVNDVDAFVE